MKLIMVLYLNTGIIMSQNLFFSEYAEGSSNNKYLEIYNGGSETINLNNYQLINCRNGCDSWEHFHPFNEDTALNASENNSGIYIARISEYKKIITHKIILLK